MRKIFLLVAFVVFGLYNNDGFAQQKNVVHQDLFWTGYSLSKKVNDAWSVNMKVEDRRFFKNLRPHQQYIALEGARKVNDKFALTSGLLYFETIFPGNPSSDFKERQPEFRPYQKVAFKTAIAPQMNFQYTFTAEERIRKSVNGTELGDHYNAYTRLRNKFVIKRKLTHEGASIPVSAFVFDDYLIHFGKTVKGSWFDQNRIGLGLDYDVLSNLTISNSYFIWYQKIPGAETYIQRNIFTIALAQRL
ncbi:MAG: DUF2490 domain-containing protein [Cyclobacteriaceae bacterium]